MLPSLFDIQTMSKHYDEGIVSDCCPLLKSAGTQSTFDLTKISFSISGAFVIQPVLIAQCSSDLLYQDVSMPILLLFALQHHPQLTSLTWLKSTLPHFPQKPLCVVFPDSLWLWNTFGSSPSNSTPFAS